MNSHKKSIICLTKQRNECQCYKFIYNHDFTIFFIRFGVWVNFVQSGMTTGVQLKQ